MTQVCGRLFNASAARRCAATDASWAKLRAGFVLLGVAGGDSEADAAHLVDRIVGMRVFADDAGKMNCSLAQVGGALLVVSQFTLLADTNQAAGRRSLEQPRPTKRVASISTFSRLRGFAMLRLRAVSSAR